MACRSVERGDYVGPGGFVNVRGYPETRESSYRSDAEDVAERLWSASAELTGVVRAGRGLTTARHPIVPGDVAAAYSELCDDTGGFESSTS